MARKQGQQKTRGAQYVAEAALTDALGDAFTGMNELDQGDRADLARRVARLLVAEAWDVEHFPVAGKVTITLDLADLDKPANDPQ